MTRSPDPPIARSPITRSPMTLRFSSAICITAVLVLFLAFRLAEQFGSPEWSSTLGEALLKFLVWGIASVFVVAIAYRTSLIAAVEELGLAANPLVGVALALASALPLLAWAYRGV